MRPVDSSGPRWFTRGSAGDRPRISVVGSLSLSVLICAGVFAAQAIFKSHQKGHDSAVADSGAAMRLAARTADDSEDDSAAPVSVSSRVRHVHAPSAHGHSTRAVATDDRATADDGLVSDASGTEGSASSKSHHHATRAVQHASDDAEVLPADLDGTAHTAEHSTHAPLDPMSGAPDFASQAAARASQSQAPAQPSLPVNQAGTLPAAGSPTSLPAYPAVQPATASPGQSMDLSTPQWTGAPSTGVVPAPTNAVQVSAEAVNAGAPTLTIVPGRPENFAPVGQHAARMQPIAQAQPVAPAPVIQQQGIQQQGAPQQVAPQIVPTPAPVAVQPIATQPIASPIQPTAQQVAVENPPAAHYTESPAPAPVSAQPTGNPLASLDRTKVMSFQFRNAPWSLVLAKFAAATGLELRLQTMPDGTFNRWDAARYTPSQTLAILNSELAKLGCQAKIVGSSLYVTQIGAAETAAAPGTGGIIPTSASMPAPSAQQYSSSSAGSR